jgi:hypothetical protein
MVIGLLGDGTQSEHLVAGILVKEYGYDLRLLRDSLERILPLDGFYLGKNIVIPGVHFESDAHHVSEVGGCLVRVSKIADPNKTLHRESFYLRSDFILLDDGSAQDLRIDVGRMLHYLDERTAIPVAAH